MSTDNSDSDNDKTQKIEPSELKSIWKSWLKKASVFIGIALMAIIVLATLGTIGLYFAAGQLSADGGGTVTVEPPTVVTLKCDGTMGFHMGSASGHRHGVLSVDYLGDDEHWDKTPVENFTIRPVWPDSEGNCRVGEWNDESKKLELSGPALTASILDQVLDGTRANGIAREGESLIVTCHAELSNNDCRLDAKPDVKKDVKKGSAKSSTKTGKVNSDQTLVIAKAAVVQSLAAKQAAEQAQMTADEALAVANDNKGMLAQILSHFGLTSDGEDVDKDKGDKPKS